MQVVCTERDGRGVSDIPDSYKQLQRPVASWSGDSEATEGRRQRGPEGHRSSHLRPLSPVLITLRFLLARLYFIPQNAAMK